MRATSKRIPTIIPMSLRGLDFFLDFGDPFGKFAFGRTAIFVIFFESGALGLIIASFSSVQVSTENF